MTSACVDIRRLRALDLDFIDDLQAVLFVPLLADLDEAVLGRQLVGGRLSGRMLTRAVRTCGSRAARWSSASSAARA